MNKVKHKTDRQLLIELRVKVVSIESKLNKLLRSNSSKQAESNSVGAVITAYGSYEWGDMTLTLTPANWRKVKNGKQFKIRGKGWRLEDAGNGGDYFKWDYWEFNGGIGKNFKVLMKFSDGDEEFAYDEILLSDNVTEYTVSKNSKK